MARSSYIYIVTDAEKNILAAFTVKHELQTWIARQPSVEGYGFWRVHDGLWSQFPPRDMAGEMQTW